MRHFRKGVAAALVLWAVAMSVAAAVRQAHADETSSRVDATGEPEFVGSAAGEAGAR